jgi:hypothetical protein
LSTQAREGARFALEASGNGNFTGRVPNSLLEKRQFRPRRLQSRLDVTPSRSIFSNALNFRCSAIAALVRFTVTVLPIALARRTLSIARRRKP